MPYAGLIRISRVGGREGERFLSPAVQREAIERLAAVHGIEVSEIVEERDVSGGTAIEQRPVGRLVERIEAGELDGLVVWRVSRYSRNLLDGITIASRIVKAGGRLLGEDIDSAAPLGRAVMALLLGMAEEELDQRRAGWATAIDRANARGDFAGRIPFGYRREPDTNPKTRSRWTGPLLPDPETAPIVVEMFRLRAQGRSLGECAGYLRAHTNLKASRTTARTILHNPVYLGRIEYGGKVYRDTHEPIVPERLWAQAQQRGAATPRNGAQAGQGILAGIARCASCGYRLNRGVAGPKHRREALYVCRDPRCESRPAVRVSVLDGYVLPMLKERAPSVRPQDFMHAMIEANAAVEIADLELSAFLETASVSALGDRYNAEVQRRRDTLGAAIAEFSRALQAVQEMNQAGNMRGIAGQLLESVTVRRAKNHGEPIADRVTITWR